MISANDNLRKRERRIEIDCWDEGGGPYLVTVFDPSVQPEPVICEIFGELAAARIAARSYARIHRIARIYDMTEGAA